MQVEIYDWVKTNGSVAKEIMIGVGEFLAWGIDFTQTDTGPGMYSTAIVKMDDGHIKNVPVELIRVKD